MKNSNIWWWVFGTCILIILLFVWSNKLAENDPNTASQRGIHWHPQIHIFVDDVEMPLPENIGLSNGHNPIHTHDEDAKDSVVHFEFSGVVKDEDIRLQSFFDSWGKSINDFGTLTKMEVNGEPNTDNESYIIKEEDIINLYYQSNK